MALVDPEAWTQRIGWLLADTDAHMWTVDYDDICCQLIKGAGPNFVQYSHNGDIAGTIHRISEALRVLRGEATATAPPLVMGAADLDLPAVDAVWVKRATEVTDAE